MDFAQDKTGFFDDAPARETIRRAANDWAYFIDEMNLDEVPAGQELTWIWEASGFESGRTVTNTNSYTGFLLYAYGIGTDELKSGESRHIMATTSRLVASICQSNAPGALRSRREAISTLLAGWCLRRKMIGGGQPI